MSGFAVRLRARICRVTAKSDRGTTLIELVVGMAIMTVFMSIFLAAVVMMSNTANKVEATSISASQTSQAFLRLDKLVRYTSAISTPGVSAASGDWYVEMDTPTTAGDTCTQLRIDSGQLWQRTWTITGGVASTSSAWRPIASGITNGTSATPPGDADAPFSFPAAISGAGTSFQRLTITLKAKSGNSTTATNRAQMTFTALNSDVSQPGNATTCPQGGRP